jgi:hydroxypyruvate reductase
LTLPTSPRRAFPCCPRGANAVDVAELAFGMLLAVGRDMLRGDRQVRGERWPGLQPVVNRDSGRHPGIGDLRKRAREIDFLVLALPGGAATRHVVDAVVLDALGPAHFSPGCT